MNIDGPRRTNTRRATLSVPYRNFLLGHGRVCPGLASSPNFIDVSEQIRRILVDTISAAALQFVTPVSSEQEPDTERARSAGRQHVPDAVPDPASGRKVHSQRVSCRDKTTGVGL